MTNIITDNKDTYLHGYKFRIYPNEEQIELIDKFINLRRFVYNWGIAREQEQYQMKQDGLTNKGFLSFFSLCKEYKEFRDKPENKWLKEFPNTTARLALRDVVHAYEKFFNKKGGFPKFKSKKHSKTKNMFKTRNDRFYIDGDKLRFEGLLYSKYKDISNDMINLEFDTPFKRTDNIKYIQPSISKDILGNYWVSFSIEEPKETLDIPQTGPIGVDVGIRQTLVLSTVEIFHRPNDKLKRMESRRRRVQKHVSKDIRRRLEESKRTNIKYEDIKVSKRSEKRSLKLKQLYTKETNIKNTWYHTIIKKNIIERNPSCVVIEDISVREIQRSNKHRNHQFRYALFHADFYTIHQIIVDKCNKYNIPVIRADKQYPSSQICSNCGYRQSLKSDNYVYTCPQCGMRLDRDINAAINLSSLAYSI